MNYFPRWRWWARFFRDDGVFIFLSFFFLFFLGRSGGTVRALWFDLFFFLLQPGHTAVEFELIELIDRKHTRKKKTSCHASKDRSIPDHHLFSSDRSRHCKRGREKKQNTCEEIRARKVKGSLTRQAREVKITFFVNIRSSFHIRRYVFGLLTLSLLGGVVWIVICLVTYIPSCRTLPSRIPISTVRICACEISPRTRREEGHCAEVDVGEVFSLGLLVVLAVVVGGGGSCRGGRGVGCVYWLLLWRWH
jgi:hypothetical protein